MITISQEIRDPSTGKILRRETKKLEVRQYPDGTPLLTYEFEKDIYTCEVRWCFDSMDELFIIACLAEKAFDCGVYLTLEIPYLPNARMDRVKNPEDVYTLKTFMHILNAFYIDKLVIVDAHSDVVKQLSAAKITGINTPIAMDPNLGNALKDLTGFDHIHYPDNGAKSKYSQLFEDHFSILKEYTSSYSEKKRNWETGKIEGLEVHGDVAGKNILMIDDISSYGGTFLHNARKLKEMGAKSINLWVTHCENSILEGELIKNLGTSGEQLIDNIYTTDSIYSGEHENIIPLLFYRKID